MTLKKALEILNDLSTTSPQFPPEERRQAVSLSIEALKRTNTRREHLSWKLEPLLPGETTE